VRGKRRWTIGWFLDDQYKAIAEGRSRIRVAAILIVCTAARPDLPLVLRWEP
jgi:hypothetical protein